MAALAHSIYSPTNEQFYSLAQELAKLPSELLFVEIGTRAGDSARDTMHAIAESGVPRWFFTVDPYGMKPYRMGEHVCAMDYDDAMYRAAMRDLYALADKLGINYVHWRMTSMDFMRVFPSIDFWTGGEKFQRSGETLGRQQVGFAYLDGEHCTEIVQQELRWCLARLGDGGVVLMDDAQMLVEPATLISMQATVESMLPSPDWDAKLASPYPRNQGHHRAVIRRKAQC